eukprot:Hpha_TRINITY_DN15907_c0_g1::TRINITY_DN15907_c0_g1_i1::g.70630::m.70630
MEEKQKATPARGAADAEAEEVQWRVQQEYYCRDCCMVLNSYRQALIHISGQRHQEQVARLTRFHAAKGLPYQPCDPEPYTAGPVPPIHPPPRRSRAKKGGVSVGLSAPHEAERISPKGAAATASKRKRKGRNRQAEAEEAAAEEEKEASGERKSPQQRSSTPPPPSTRDLVSPQRQSSHPTRPRPIPPPEEQEDPAQSHHTSESQHERPQPYQHHHHHHHLHHHHSHGGHSHPHHGHSHGHHHHHNHHHDNQNRPREREPPPLPPVQQQQGIFIPREALGSTLAPEPQQTPAMQAMMMGVMQQMWHTMVSMGSQPPGMLGGPGGAPGFPSNFPANFPANYPANFPYQEQPIQPPAANMMPPHDADFMQPEQLPVHQSQDSPIPSRAMSPTVEVQVPDEEVPAPSVNPMSPLEAQTPPPAERRESPVQGTVWSTPQEAQERMHQEGTAPQVAPSTQEQGRESESASYHTAMSGNPYANSAVASWPTAAPSNALQPPAAPHHATSPAERAASSKLKALIHRVLFECDTGAVADIQDALGGPTTGVFVNEVFELLFQGGSPKAYSELCHDVCTSADHCMSLNGEDLRHMLVVRCRTELTNSENSQDPEEMLRVKFRRSHTAKFVAESFMRKLLPEALLHLAVQLLLYGKQVSKEEPVTADVEQFASVCKMIQSAGARLCVSSPEWTERYCAAIRDGAAACGVRRVTRLAAQALEACAPPSKSD